MSIRNRSMLVFIYPCEYEIRKVAKFESKSNLQYLSQRQFDSQMLANEMKYELLVKEKERV